MICIAIDNDSNSTVGGSCYSSHQAVGKFAEHHIDMVSGNGRLELVSEDVNKTLECITITDSTFCNGVLV